MKLDLEQIKDLIPHRDPFLFVDTCEIISQVSTNKKGCLCGISFFISSVFNIISLNYF